ncbi:hypothetical protein CR513_10189, partial [Mucuna pruriens]
MTSVHQKLPPKLKDSGGFSIPYLIRNTRFGKVLCDIGASVSLIPFCVCKRIDMGDLKFTGMSIQLVDKSIKHLIRVLKDVPVPFLTIVDMIVDIDSSNQSMEEEKTRAYFRDSLKAYLTREVSLDLRDDATKYVKLIEITPFLNPRKTTIEKLELGTNEWDVETSPRVELKLLPSILIYEFLVLNSSYLVIVNANLSEIETQNYLKVIGYSMEGINRINPSLCVHRILMVEGHKSYFDYQ